MTSLYLQLQAPMGNRGSVHSADRQDHLVRLVKGMKPVHISSKGILLHTFP